MGAYVVGIIVSKIRRLTDYGTNLFFNLENHHPRSPPAREHCGLNECALLEIPKGHYNAVRNVKMEPDQFAEYLPFGWSLLDFGQRALLVALLTASTWWALTVAWRDAKWAHEVSSDYAKFKGAQIAKISKPSTAAEKLESLDLFVAERVDAARAKAARLVFLGCVYPSLVLLVLLGWHSWLFPGQCALSSLQCEPSLKEALTFTAWNQAVGFRVDEALSFFRVPLPDVATLQENYFLGFAAFAARNYALGHVFALVYFEIKVWQFRHENNDIREALQKIADQKHGTFVDAVPEVPEHETSISPEQLKVAA